MPLDPEVVPILDHLKSIGLWESTTVEAARAGVIAPGASAEAPVSRAEDLWIAGPGGPLRLRLYRPDAAAVALPVLVWIHGGGWIRGDVDGPSADTGCQALADKANVVVASVDYGLAPEHRFPEGLDDCIAALGWVSKNANAIGGDSSRMAVGGESSGGNLAAAVAIAAREAGGPSLAFQLLVYPVTDLTFSLPSHVACGDDYGLTRARMCWYRDHYVRDGDEALFKNPLLSPLHVEDALGLPPAFIVTAEYDPLRDEGEAYGAKLAAAGVPTTVRRYDGQIHGFAAMSTVLSAARRAGEEAAAALAAALHGDRA